MSYIPNKWCEYEFIYLYLYLDFILTNIMNFHVDELLFNSETLLMLIGFHSTLTHDRSCVRSDSHCKGPIPSTMYVNFTYI